MQITRSLAMQSASILSSEAVDTYASLPSLLRKHRAEPPMSEISYSGTYTETLFINRTDTAIIRNNLDATRHLLDAMRDTPIMRNGAFMYSDCDVSNILKFIGEYSFASRNRDCKPQAAARQTYYEMLGREVPGLLVIYPIKKDSIPKNEGNKRFKALNAAGNLIGLLFVFPIVKNRDLHQYMQIPLANEEKDDDAI